jgi:hypothetical protein
LWWHSKFQGLPPTPLKIESTVKGVPFLLEDNDDRLEMHDITLQDIDCVELAEYGSAFIPM